MKFREHRGHLADSMETLVEIADRAELVAHLSKILWPYSFPVKDEDIEVKKYFPRADPRCGWQQTYIVVLAGYGPIGYTDGPIPGDTA